MTRRRILAALMALALILTVATFCCACTTAAHHAGCHESPCPLCAFAALVRGASGLLSRFIPALAALALALLRVRPLRVPTSGGLLLVKRKVQLND